MPNVTETIDSTRRPSLEPIWTLYQNLNGLPKTAFRPANSPEGLTPSPMSPKSLPSPIYPSYDRCMELHERAMVSRLNGLVRQSTTSITPPRHVDEDSPLAKQFEEVTILPPLNLQHGLPPPPSPAPIFAPQPTRHPLRRSRTVLEPTTMTLDHALPEEPFRELERRNSTAKVTRPLPPPPPIRKESFVDIRDQLRSWGHVYYGNAKTADAFVIARSLRQHSGTAVDFKADIGSPKIRNSNQMTIRAIIRPRALERQSFLIQRSFDIEALCTSVPDPVESSLPAIQEHQSTTSGLQALPRPIYHRRRSSAKSIELLSRHGRTSVCMDYEALVHDAKAVPIHLKYARAWLPVLAALLQSGHIREGDIIYLPLPHAEAWPQTIKYLYTGHGELTEAVKENITYLAGKF
ncbi:hypothetical protein TruAng_009391 [Truncatella angustata]|nr:hypothetical protein TruAng_009391 [Truncatella angustata]